MEVARSVSHQESFLTCTTRWMWVLFIEIENSGVWEDHEFDFGHEYVFGNKS